MQLADARALAPLGTLVLLALPAAAQCPTQMVTSPDVVAAGNFGRSAALDGSTLCVGEIAAGDFRVQVFEADPGGAWLPVQTLSEPSVFDVNEFGAQLELDGDTLAVRADPLNESLPGLGKADGKELIFLYERQGSSFVPTQTIDVGLPAGDFLSRIREIALDGDTLVVAIEDFSITNGFQYVEVYERAGSSWSLAVTLAAPAGFPALGFGDQVAVEGDRIVATQFGSWAHCFERTAGVWAYTETETVFTCGEDTGLSAIAIEAGRLLLGAYWYSGACPSEIRVFEATGAGGSFELAETVTLPALAASGERWRPYLKASGDRILVATDNGFGKTGEEHPPAYVFERSGGSFGSPSLLLPPWPANNPDGMGWRIDISGPRAVVTASQNNVLGVGTGSVIAWSMDPGDCRSLLGVPPERSIEYIQGAPGYPTAGRHDLALDAGPDRAGDLYLLLGSASGTAPGIGIDGFVVPLVFDAWTAFTLASPNAAPYQNSFGTLDTGGRALAVLQVPVSVDVSLAGTTLQHAFVAIDPSAGPAVTFASNAAPFTLVD